MRLCRQADANHAPAGDPDKLPQRRLYQLRRQMLKQPEGHQKIDRAIVKWQLVGPALLEIRPDCRIGMRNRIAADIYPAGIDPQCPQPLDQIAVRASDVQNC